MNTLTIVNKLGYGINKKDAKEIADVFIYASRSFSVESSLSMLLDYLKVRDPEDLTYIIERFINNLIELSEEELQHIVITGLIQILHSLFRMVDEVNMVEINDRIKNLNAELIRNDEKTDSEESSSLSYILAVALTTTMSLLADLNAEKFNRALDQATYNNYRMTFSEVKTKLKEKFGIDLLKPLR